MNPPRIVHIAHDHLEAAAQRLRREIDPRIAWANVRAVDPGAGPR